MGDAAGVKSDRIAEQLQQMPPQPGAGLMPAKYKQPEVMIQPGCQRRRVKSRFPLPCDLPTDGEKNQQGERNFNKPPNPAFRVRFHGAVYSFTMVVGGVTKARRKVSACSCVMSPFCSQRR